MTDHEAQQVPPNPGAAPRWGEPDYRPTGHGTGRSGGRDEQPSPPRRAWRSVRTLPRWTQGALAVLLVLLFFTMGDGGSDPGATREAAARADSESQRADEQAGLVAELEAEREELSGRVADLEQELAQAREAAEDAQAEAVEAGQAARSAEQDAAGELEAELEDRVAELDEREAALDERAEELDERDSELDQRDSQLDERAASVDEAEDETEQREARSTVGDGIHVVGEDIEPGVYRTEASSGMCYWARLSGLGGGLEDIIANGLPDGPASVEVRSGDTAFESTSCGEWRRQ